MSIVSSFCLSRPLGCGDTFTIYRGPYQPPGEEKKTAHSEPARAPSLCSLGQVVKRKNLNHLFVIISAEEGGSHSLFSLIATKRPRRDELWMTTAPKPLEVQRQRKCFSD